VPIWGKWVVKSIVYGTISPFWGVLELNISYFW
jgi:hypothetical protein